MKNLIFLFLFSYCLLQALPVELQKIMSDVKQQSSVYQASTTHQEIKQNRNTRNYQVGDTETFWKWNLSVMPPSWVQTPSTCRAVGEHCYIFVANDQWNTYMTQADVDTVYSYLETKTMLTDSLGAVQMDINLFGEVPDELDNDPKLIVFFSALGSFQGTSFDGYFSAYNQVTEAEAQTFDPPGHSNECEMIYMTCYPLDPVEPVRISVLAHELEHLIHWGQDSNEVTWVDEGCAELAMVKFGVPDPITSFPSSSDNSLITWNQQFSDYVKVMLFFTYLYEHAGGDQLISDIVANSSNSIAGIEDCLLNVPPTSNFATVFCNWAIANVVDDTLNGLPTYNYQLLDLPNFMQSDTHTILPFPWSDTGTVKAWATDYIKIVPANSDNLDHTYRLNTSSTDPVQMAAVYFNTDNEVVEVQGPVSDEILLQVRNTLHQYSKIFLCMINTNNADQSYTYSITEEVGNSDNIQSPVLPLSVYPNPLRIVNNRLDYKIGNADASQNLEVSIYDIKGRLVHKSVQPAGQQFGSKSQANLANGIYFFKIKNGSRTEVHKTMVLK